MLAAVGVDSERQPVVVARTPPSRAAYHRFANALFGEAIEMLGRDGKARVVVLARHPEQREALRELPFPNLVVPDRAVDSRSLIYLADLVLGAGGTMTREAALMGIPTYSVFAGEQPAVDRELERRGRLRLLRSAGELVPPAPRTCQPRGLGDLRARAQTLVEFFVEHALNGA